MVCYQPLFFWEKKLNFPIHGQGVFSFFNKANRESISIKIGGNREKCGLKFIFNNTEVYVKDYRNTSILRDKNNSSGLIESKGAYYWISIDSQNQRLLAGIGEPRTETIVFEYSFIDCDDNIFEDTKVFLESLTYLKYNKFYIKRFKMLKDPIVATSPLTVKNTDQLTMDDIALNKYLPDSHLNPVCQQLYNSIRGTKFVLDDENFPEFTEAIEYSINTEGCWCNKKLKEKSTEFNKDNPNIKETYLRITLGYNSGESPGIPYVMEIWPVGHYSPVHSHANANAIIRVLNGNISVRLYAFLCNDKNGINSFNTANFYKDDITWITPNMNQVHQLYNSELNDKTCITIQCYMYGENNKNHYDYFDYIDNDGSKQQYEPDSDMEFSKFKALMKKEWYEKK